MTVDQAWKFSSTFQDREAQTLADVGMGYIKLGQQATTLSGRRRVKHRSFQALHRQDGIHPGRADLSLHFDDIRKLLDVLNHMTDSSTVIVIDTI
jgi:excinuclease ABC subunit A